MQQRWGTFKRGDLDAAMVIVPTPAEMDVMSLTMSPLIDKLITNNKTDTNTYRYARWALAQVNERRIKKFPQNKMSKSTSATD